MRASSQIREPTLMWDGLRILARNNFAGPANPTHIFCGPNTGAGRADPLYHPNMNGKKY